MIRTFKHGVRRGRRLRGARASSAPGCLRAPSRARQPNTNTNFTAVVHNQTVDKVDLLFMIDNSASMGDKQALLALAVPNMINRLVDAELPRRERQPGRHAGRPDGIVHERGRQGRVPARPRHAHRHRHARRSAAAAATSAARRRRTRRTGAQRPQRRPRRAHQPRRRRRATPPSRTRRRRTSTRSNFLSWFPNVPPNAGKPHAAAARHQRSQATLVSDFTTLVEGVHEHGCGFEAQNEAWYRFLVQPDPFDQINEERHTRATLHGDRRRRSSSSARLPAARLARSPSSS